jgi:hypothetical protein
MEERGISKEEILWALKKPEAKYPGNLGRTVVERTPPGRSLANKVVYNLGAEEERIVVAFMRGRPSRQER